MDIVINKSNLKGKLNIITSKSIAHRAIVSALVTSQETTIKNVNLCDDVENTLSIIRKLRKIELKGNDIVIGNEKECDSNEFFVYESMSTFNFLFPYIAYHTKKEITFKLGKRLIERIGDEYQNLYSNSKECYFIKNEEEIKVKGFSFEKEMTISNKMTSQCASGILFLMASTQQDCVLNIDSDNSLSYIDETIRILKEFGKDIKRENYKIFVMYNQENKNREYNIPFDGSDYLLKSAIKRVFENTVVPEGCCLKEDPDYKLLLKLKENNFVLPDEIDLKDNPDAIFALSLFAIKKETPTKFINIERLSIKESNRIECVKEVLNKFGYKAETTKSTLTIYPGAGKKATVESYNDHRIVQLETILASLYGGEIKNAECVSKSYPHFFDDLKENGLNYFEESTVLFQKLENKESKIVFSKSNTTLNTEKDKKYVVITDNNVFELYKKEIDELFEDALIYIVKERGENAKTISEYERLCSFLIKNNVAKDDCLVAFGGGTITDLTGYTASTYKRGINMISIPTSLIAMTDASIGFKTALNIGNTKNAVGDFCVPNEIIINTSYLKTLPEKEIKSGMAEIIKIFALKSEKYFNKILIENYKKNLSDWILEAIKLKLEFVSKDPYDKKERHALNFGHTYGHAFELIENISHGEAVAKGMRVLSLSKDLNDCLNKYGYDVPTKEEIENAKEIIKNDKKIENGILKVVKVKKIGSYEIEEETI